MRLTRPMRLLANLFGPRASAKHTADDPLRHRTELSRLTSDEEDWEGMSEDVRERIGFSRLEKQVFYSARQMLRWLPATGPNGSWQTEVAARVQAQGLKATKQYVSQVLFPRDARRLFASRTMAYKAIWTALASLVEERMRENPMLGEFVRVLDQLEQGNAVWIRAMRTDRLSLISGKIKAAGLRVRAYVATARVPHDYLLVPEERQAGVRPKAGSGSLVIERLDGAVGDRLRSDYDQLEFVGVPRSEVDLRFPDASRVSRLGHQHYLVSLAA